MDRIYYFMLAKENVGKSVELPVFCKRVGEYEVYYLQVPPHAGKQELAAVKAWMEKGISRLQNCYELEVGAGGTYLVHDGAFANWLQEKQLVGAWKDMWDFPLYREYTQPHNLRLLLQQLSAGSWPGKWIVLGEATGISDWIEDLAKYMKSITFFAQNPPGGWEQLQEYLQKEYGLLTEWYRSFHPISAEPAMVLDYCTREKVFVWDIRKGSIWIDMNSMESRRRDVQERDTGILYCSLKRFWKEEIIQTLDTFNKIQYNT